MKLNSLAAAGAALAWTLATAASAATAPTPQPAPAPTAPAHCTDGHGNDAANSANCPGSKNYGNQGPKSK